MSTTNISTYKRRAGKILWWDTKESASIHEYAPSNALGVISCLHVTGLGEPKVPYQAYLRKMSQPGITVIDE